MCVAFLEYLMLSTRAAFGMFLTLSLNWAALIPVHSILIVGVGERARSFFAGGSGEDAALRCERRENKRVGGEVRKKGIPYSAY